MMSRRNTLLGLGAAGAAFAGMRSLFFSGSARAAQPTRAYEVTFADVEWKKRLTPAQYQVLRQARTERPFTSPLDKEKRSGVFNCAGCALPLFSSRAKFDSRTGWPSFYQPIAAAALVEETDSTLGMKRTEVLCHRCSGHLGHVFDDGPKPTGLRYCMNGVAMNFTPT